MDLLRSIGCSTPHGVARFGIFALVSQVDFMIDEIWMPQSCPFLTLFPLGVGLLDAGVRWFRGILADILYLLLKYPSLA